MKTIGRINWHQFTRVGVSKKGVMHIGYWCDAKESIKWTPVESIMKRKRFSRQSLGELSFLLGQGVQC